MADFTASRYRHDRIWGITVTFVNLRGRAFRFQFLWQTYPDSKVLGANMGPIWADRSHAGPMLAPWTLLSGHPCLMARRYRKHKANMGHIRVKLFYMVYWQYSTTWMKNVMVKFRKYILNKICLCIIDALFKDSIINAHSKDCVIRWQMNVIL